MNIHRTLGLTAGIALLSGMTFLTGCAARSGGTDTTRGRSAPDATASEPASPIGNSPGAASGQPGTSRSGASGAGAEGSTTTPPQLPQPQQQ